MKKFVFPLLLALLAACTLQLEEEVNSAEIADRLKRDANQVALMKRSHKFPLDSAAILVSDMLLIPTLNKMANSFAAGGTFPARLFRVSPDSSGIILWYGFDPHSREVFLALEQLKNYDVANMPKYPTASKLVRSASIFTRTITSPVDRLSIKTQFQNERITDNEVQSIDNATLRKRMNSFDSLLRTMPDGKGEKYNQYLFSFFHDSRDGTFDNFLDQAGRNGYVRYYFGYDERDKPNRIRVILVAVDADGRNVTSINAGGRTNDEGDGVTLQKSWPPPSQ